MSITNFQINNKKVLKVEHRHYNNSLTEKENYYNHISINNKYNYCSKCLISIEKQNTNLLTLIFVHLFS